MRGSCTDSIYPADGIRQPTQLAKRSLNSCSMGILFLGTVVGFGLSDILCSIP